MKTEIFEANSTSDGVDFNKLNSLEPKDVANAVHYVLATPPNVQVLLKFYFLRALIFIFQ